MITDLLAIVEASAQPYRRDRVTVWATPNGCANFVLAGITTCSLNVPDRGVYVQATWNPIEFVDVIDGNENIEGDLIKFIHRKRGTLSFNCIVDEARLEDLHIISLHKSMTIRNIDTGAISQIEELTITTTDAVDVMTAVVAFRVIGADSVVTACCDSYYAGAPYEDPCDPDGGGPNPPNGDCADYEVVISYDAGNDTLTAFPSGTATGPDTYQWLYDDGGGFVILSPTAQTITATAAGTYRVSATRVSCLATSDFLLQEDCTGFSVALEFTNGVLIASANMVSTFAWTLDTIPIAGETGPTLIPTGSGTYEVTATAGACEDIASLVVNTPEACLLDFDLAIIGDDLIISNIADCNGVASYAWEVDTGDGQGFQVIPTALGDTHEMMVSGNYRATVTCDGDGCSKAKTILAISDCVAFRGYIAAVTPDVGGGVRLTAASANAPAAVIYDWYKFEGDTWVLQFTGNPYIIAAGSGDHQIKLVTSSGSCIREDYLAQCVNPDSIAPYQAFVAVGPNENNFTVLAFTFIQPDDQGGAATPNEINARYLTEKNGLVLSYVALATIAADPNPLHYSYDFASNEIILPDAWVLFTGDRLTTFDRQA